MLKFIKVPLYLLLLASIISGCSAADNAIDNAIDTVSDTANDAVGNSDNSTGGSSSTTRRRVAYVPCANNSTGVTQAELDEFQTDEYYRSGAGVANDKTPLANDKTPLANICAATAYARIKKLAAADSNVKQGGAGQIVAVLDTPYSTAHPEFDTNFFYYNNGDAFTSYYNASDGSTSKASIDCSYANGCTTGHGSNVAGIVGARKGVHGYMTNMHGVAYAAKIKAIAIFNKAGTGNTTSTKLADAIRQGSNLSGTNIVAMNNSWGPAAIVACVKYQGTDYYYKHPAGHSHIRSSDCKTRAISTGITEIEITAWKEVIDSGTISVFANGNDGFNSETGMVTLYSSISDANNNNDPAQTVATGTLLGASRADIPSEHGKLPNKESTLLGKWLTVVAVDSDAKIANFSNGCGSAMNFCLAAPGVGIFSASNPTTGEAPRGSTASGSSQAAPHVSGAIAVLKAAYPSLTPEQLVSLVLETATDLGLEGVDEVYGHGLLNLNAATLPVGNTNAVGFDNVALAARMDDTSLTLANHFGGGMRNIKLGMRDKYERTFTTAPSQSVYETVPVGLDDYMAGLQFALLGDNVQSERLNPQAQVNYANGGTQNWMNLQYISGKSTAKIAFQESYKSNPLIHAGVTNILRANHIRPASHNIGMMDVDYQLTRNLSLSSYAARGEYDTGFKFDELGTDIDVRYKKSALNLGVGHLREHEQFLGTNTTGAYALSAPTISQFTDVTYGHDVGNTGKFNIYANYIQYKTDVTMGYQQFANIDNLQADQYQIGFKGKNILSDDDGLNIALITKLGVTDGVLMQNTVIGYDAAGGYNNVTQSYDLAVQQRHQQFEVTYQGRLYQHGDKVSALKDNRFFTTIRVDQNLNHEEGLGQTEIIGGMQARF